MAEIPDHAPGRERGGGYRVPVMLHPHTELLERLLGGENADEGLYIAPPLLHKLREHALSAIRQITSSRGAAGTRQVTQVQADSRGYALPPPRHVRDGMSTAVCKLVGEAGPAVEALPWPGQRRPLEPVNVPIR
eukprot:gene32604-17622_t